ncbi:protein phosphatase 2A regulatory B subunit [Acanthamoeba castellanii str. Neff]|uniref:Serine/threonine-protein phosphatase 2A 55 kDa regulatory subunit B n=1 Tax=Acanthamoeba castellanii (strain ATCC 30010 / Neff) TaxID=1257118 RepID=L8HHC4_ACACF|nr:protein phosphatase 2A regulatory B subunit [Acanthamoeba castellanii str. Neff]ELR24582.1 protein phosphatase 2A regulatory B subunit [Acanthamoeba castellanii str. Neff]
MEGQDSKSTRRELDWQFCQVFGEPHFEEVTEVDIVSTVEFDSTGEYLAAGDRGGRVVIFQRVESEDTPCEYKFFAEFQSHEPEFDYLKSLEIEEKINKIKWCPSNNNSHFLLTTNDKTIKLWKVYNKTVFDPPKVNKQRNGLSEAQKTAVPRKIFANAHAYHINSISLNTDGETYISADDLRINLWNLETSDQSFNIVDIKPANMEELTEVITAAEFHPQSCNYLMYSSSKGTIKLGDLRESALCDQHAKKFEEEEDPANKSFFSEIIASISDIKFSRDGRYILSRDYLSLKEWDLRMENRPVKTIRIHDFLKAKLCDLYENDCIFDKFECSLSGSGDHLLTGSYHNYFHIYDIQSPRTNALRMKLGRGPSKKSDVELNADDIDFNKKVLHVAWHPHDDIVAVAANNNLYLYAADDDKDDSDI